MDPSPPKRHIGKDVSMPDNPHDEERIGYGVDPTGGSVIDPTANVLQLVASAIRRQDDLRIAQSHYTREIAAVREHYQTELRQAEADRIDAIRAVDVGAVNRAAEVATTQAATLAAQVAISAETLRTQVAATATAGNVALAAALEPVQKDIADLRRAQYEQQGIKAQQGENRTGFGLWIMFAGVLVAAATIVAVVLVGHSQTAAALCFNAAHVLIACP
jgi:hypothetical protein